MRQPTSTVETPQAETPQAIQVDGERQPIATERCDQRSDEVKRRYETTKRCRKCDSVTASPVSESDGAALFDSYSSESEFDGF